MPYQVLKYSPGGNTNSLAFSAQANYTDQEEIQILEIQQTRRQIGFTEEADA
jgi:hypothetical protein